MTILRPLEKSQFLVSLESTDGELIYPNCFTSTSGFNVEFRGNYSIFHPVKVTTCYDHVLFADLIGYCLDLSASRVTDNSFKEKKFDLIVNTKDIASRGNYGYSFCAHDCQLQKLRFLQVDCEDNDVMNLSLTLLPRYISRFIPEENTGDAIG